MSTVSKSAFAASRSTALLWALRGGSTSSKLELGRGYTFFTAFCVFVTLVAKLASSLSFSRLSMICATSLNDSALPSFVSSCISRWTDFPTSLIRFLSTGVGATARCNATSDWLADSITGLISRGTPSGPSKDGKSPRFLRISFGSSPAVLTASLISTRAFSCDAACFWPGENPPKRSGTISRAFVHASRAARGAVSPSV